MKKFLLIALSSVLALGMLTAGKRIRPSQKTSR